MFGDRRDRMVGALTILSAVLLTAATSLAVAPPGRPAPPTSTVYVGVVSACTGPDDVTTVGFTLAVLAHRTWESKTDTGLALTESGVGGIEMHSANGRYGLTGAWHKVVTRSGGENRLRADPVRERPGDVFDLLRVTYAGWTSPAVASNGVDCPAPIGPRITPRPVTEPARSGKEPAQT